MAQAPLSILIPCFDESHRLPASLDAIAGFLQDRREATELLIVDDGSRDGTGPLAERRAEELGLRCRVVRHAPNRGKGFAVRRGLEEATTDLVLLTDADLSVPIRFLDRFVSRIQEGADLVIGSRRAAGAEVTRHQPWLRERLGVAFHALAARLFAPQVTDFTCGFKLFRREAAAAIASRQRIWGWGYDVELVVIARRLGLDVVEEPVQWHDDRQTRVRLLRDVARSAVDLARLAWHDARGRYGEGRLSSASGPVRAARASSSESR